LFRKLILFYILAWFQIKVQVIFFYEIDQQMLWTECFGRRSFVELDYALMIFNTFCESNKTKLVF
jgi:hypothetical protein